MNRTALKISEADLEKAGTDLLAWDGWRSLKCDPVSRREWGKGFGERGMADRLYLRYDRMNYCLNPVGEILWIEWKRPKGKAKPHQRTWIESERARGALVLLAGEDFEATYDAFLEWYRKSGLARREIL